MQYTENDKICFCELILSHISTFIEQLFVYYLHLFVIFLSSILCCFYKVSLTKCKRKFNNSISKGDRKKVEGHCHHSKKDHRISFLKSHSLFLILLPKGTVIKPENTVPNGYPMATAAVFQPFLPPLSHPPATGMPAPLRYVLFLSRTYRFVTGRYRHR